MKAVATYTRGVNSLVELLDSELSGDFEGLPRHLWERVLGEPAREFLSREGKQFRARLVKSAWVMCGGDAHALPEALPLVLEVLHAGSLIVDDIEDEAETRRDGLALHRMYGVPLALNTGNWMYFWALNLIQELPLEATIRASLAREASKAVERCHRGQALDLALDIWHLERTDVPKVVRATTRLKTGALMELAAVLGAIAAGGSDAQVEALRSFGRGLGEGLQMLDDLGSLTSPDRAHKAVEDLVHGRPTWPWAWLASSVGEREFEGFRDHLAKVMAGSEDPGRLACRLGESVAADGRLRVHSSLHLTLADLETVFGTVPTVRVLRSEIERLEKSYE